MSPSLSLQSSSSSVGYLYESANPIVEHVQVSEINVLKELGVAVSPSTVKKNEAPSTFKEEIGRFKHFPYDQVGKKFAFMIIFCGPKVFGEHVIKPG